MLGAVAPILFVTACGGGQDAPPVPASSTAAPTTMPTQPEILGAAGPLPSHIEHTSEVICDDTTASVTQDGSDLDVHLSFWGPAVASADVETDSAASGDQASVQNYTLVAGQGGHDFFFPSTSLAKVVTVSVQVMSDRGTGGCEVIDRTQG